MKFADIAENSAQAMSIKYNTMVYEAQRKGKDVLVMSLGEAFFDIPLFPMDDLPYPGMYHYSNSRGIPELREKLSEFFLEKYDIPFNYEKEIIITAGSKAAIHFAFMAIINPGEEVIIPEPYWVSYPEQVKLCYGKPVTVPYHVPVSDFEKYVTKKTKAIVINTPNNPSGHVYTEPEIRELLRLAEKYDLWILSDEAYSEFVDDDSFISPAKIDRDKKHTIVFNSISKNYGISGWRLGYVIGNEQLIYNILKINQHVITCPATILEYYVVKYFRKILDYTEPQIKQLICNRRKIAQYMDGLGLKYLPGNATFYFFVSIAPSRLSSEQFASRLLHEYYISVVPGIGYGESCDQFVRVSVGTAELDEIYRGLTTMKRLIDETSRDSQIGRKNSALVVCGGLWQVPLVKFLKTKGLKITIVDPYLHSPAVAYADKHIAVDVRDHEKVEREIHGLEFDFAVTDQSDVGLMTVARINNRIIPGKNKVEVVEKFINKYLMKKHAREMSVPVPDFSIVQSLIDLETFIEVHGLPVVIKPVDAQSSRGFFCIDQSNIERIPDLMAESLCFSNCNTLIVEKFVSGREITVEGICIDGKHRCLASSIKTHFRPGLASSLRYPAQIPVDLLNEIFASNDRLVDGSGLDFGLTHAEYMVNLETQEYYLIEIACRGGGTLISSDIVQWISGVDCYEILYQSILGNKSSAMDVEVTSKPALLQFFEFPCGRVKSIEGLEKIRNHPAIHSFALSFRAGDELQPATDDRSRQGYAVILGEDDPTIDDALKHITETLKINYE